MTFMHKLSRRLAQTHEAGLLLPGLVLLLGILIACEIPTVAANPNAVAQLVVFPESLTLDPGQRTVFRAHGVTAAGDSTSILVSWTATGGTIDQSGTFTADTSGGDVSVTATSPTLKLSASSHVHVRPHSVASLALSPSIVTIPVGQTTQLTATAFDTRGNPVSGVLVTWSSSNTAAAIVSGSGLVTGVAAGSATITAAGAGQSATSAITVTAAPVASVTVAPASADVAVGQTVQLTATPKDASGNTLTGRVITWTTGNSAVATVSSSGLVTGQSAGSATITATSETINGTATVGVTLVPVATVSVSPAPASVAVGQTVQLSATTRDPNGNVLTGRVVTWSSNNTAAATVNTNGLVTGVGVGSATITATSETKSGTASVTVTQVPVASVTVSPAAPSVNVGQTVQLTATTRDANNNVLTGRVVTWNSSNTAFATVNTNGVVTGVAAGSATITAMSETKSGTTSVTVTQVPVASVSVTPATASVAAGQTVQLTATTRDANGNVLTGRVFTWSSSNTAVATVNGSGLVTGVAAGSATITATSETKNGTASVTVTSSGGGGGTILLQEHFEDNNFAARGWYDNPAMTVTDTEHIPGSTAALEIHFTQGATQPTWGGVSRRLFTGSSTMYLSFWVKYSANWMGSGTPDHPHEFEFLTSEEASYAGPAYTHLSALVEDNYQNGGVPRVSLVDGKNIDESNIGVDLTNVTENRAAQGCNGNTDGYPTDCYDNGGYHNNGKIWNAAQPYFLPNPGPGYKGDWHFVEVYFQLNSIQNGKGMPDGIVRYWVDGQLAIEHTNVLFRTGVHTTMQFNQFLIAPYIGVGSPVDQTMWVDELTVATAKP